MKETRKLAAVVFTDIVGYTALMSQDEQTALNMLKQNRDIQKKLVGKYNGEFLKEMGDSTLLRFQSALDAVRCAIEIQRSARSESDLNLRIGIHIGDIVFKEGDIYGDGVNVASRVEQLAPTGGICITGQVYYTIRNRPDIQAAYIGKKRLKNVDKPVEIYRVRDDTDLPSKPKAERPMKRKRSRIKKILLGFGLFFLIIIGFMTWFIYPFLSIPDPVEQQHDRSIAVLYFDNMSAPEDAYFADGLTEELISRLTRIQNLRVASRTDVRIYKTEATSTSKIGEDLKVDYVLEGSVRKAGNKIRITAQLINTGDGFHRWTETYNRELTDIFQVQDDVAMNIAQNLDMEITNRDRSAITKRPTDNLEAYDLFLRAKSKLITLGPMTPDSEFEDLHSILERCVNLDPRYVDARSSLAASNLIHFIMRGWNAEDKIEKNRLLQRALSSSKIALEEDPQNEIALTVMPITLLLKATENLGNEDEFKPLLHRKASIKINRLAELYPNSPIANLGLGTFYYYLYKAKLPIHTENISQMVIKYHQKALEASKRILKATPNDPIALYTAGDSYLVIGLVHCNQGRYQEALYYFKGQNEINLRTGNKSYEITSTTNMGFAFEKIGKYDEAIACFERVLQIVTKLEHFEYISSYLYSLGRLCKLKGDYSRALDYYNKRLVIDLDKGYTFRQGFDLLRIGEMKFLVGNYAKASEYFKSAIEIWTDRENKKEYLWANSWLALAELKLGNLDTADTIAHETEIIMKNIEPNSYYVVMTHWNLAQVYQELEQAKKFRKHLEVAYKVIIREAEAYQGLKSRSVFLEDIQENREIIAVWEKLNQ